MTTRRREAVDGRAPQLAEALDREQGPEGRGPALAARREVVALLLIVAVGIALRGFRLGWGVPGFSFPDAVIHFIRPAATAAAGGPALPREFVHPPVLVFILTGAFRLWSALLGEPIPPGIGYAAPQIGTLDVVGRVTMVAIAAVSIVALYMVGRRLFGVRAGLLAAACFSLSPLHVLESHRVAPDIPMILLAVLAMHLAVVGMARRGAALGAFAVAGVAAATKYTGAFAATVPAWVMWVRAPRHRWRLLAAGALAAVLAFALACVACLCQLEGFFRGVRLIGRFGYLAGMPGVDLTGHWPQYRYVYALLVALPYMMGWPMYVAACAGLVLLWRRDRRAAGVLIAALAPYLLFMGGAVSAVPRYYLALCPALALAAGVALDFAWGTPRGWRAIGPLVVCAAIGYTALLTASHVARLGLGPQREVGALVAALADERGGPGGRGLVVAYPNRIALYYDAVASFLRRPGVKIVDLPGKYGHPGANRPDEGTGAGLADAGDWLRAEGVDAVVLPSWVENAVLRSGRAGQAGRFFHELGTGSLGFHLAGDFRSHYLTERLYTWGDAMLDTHWETAIAGYKVFVRTTAGG